MEDINPTLKHAIRKFKLNSSIAENKSAAIVKPFFDKLSKMSGSDYAKYDLALKNGMKNDIDILNGRYDLKKEYKAVKDLLRDIREEVLSYGMDVEEIQDYFPRKVIKPSKLLEEYSKTSYLKKMINELPSNLSEEEKIEKINAALKGHNGAINANSSFVKKRSIILVNKELNRYYKDSKYALADYITNMNNAIQIRKFFGKGDNINDSIGAFAKNLSDAGIISPSDEVELKKLLSARFNQKGVSGIVSDIKNIGYITSMGNPFSTITQIGDFAFSFYQNGVFNTMLGMKSALSKNKITKKDLGIEKIAQEFESESKTGKLVDKIFKIVGLSHIDSLGKETFINASFNRLRNQAVNALDNPNSEKSKKFYKDLSVIFGKDTNNVLNDLKNRNNLLMYIAMNALNK